MVAGSPESLPSQPERPYLHALSFSVTLGLAPDTIGLIVEPAMGYGGVEWLR